MSEPPPPQTADNAVRAFILLFALGFVLRGIDVMDHDMPSAIQKWAIAAIMSVADYFYVPIRTKLGDRFTNTAASVATDFRWWATAILVILLGMTFSPYVEQRRWPFSASETIPNTQTPTVIRDPPSAEDIAKATEPYREQGAIVAKQLGAALMERDALKSQLTAVQKQLDDVRHQLESTRKAVPSIKPIPVSGPVSWNLGGQLMVGSYNGQSYAVNGLIFQGTSEVSLHFKEAYLISGLTGHKAELLANVHTVGGYYPITAVDVPAGAPVQLDYIFKPELSVRDFFDQWGRFRFVVVYDNGSSFDHEFSEEEVREQAQRQFPNAFGPQVTPRDNK